MGLIDNIVTAVTGRQLEKRAMPEALLPANRATQGSVTSVGEAMTLPAVYRAVSIISTTVKQMNVEVIKDDLVITKPSLIAKPNPNTSFSTFVEQTIVSLATNGNAYWEIVRDSTNRVIALIPLNPLDMSVEATATGTIVKYIYNGKDYDPSRIKHITLLQVPGSPYGLGPIQAAGQSLKGHTEMRDYASKWFSESGVPSGILSTDQFLNGDQLQAVKQTWKETGGAKNGVAILGNSWSYQPMYLKPEDLQWLSAQQFNITEVARMFGVPSTLMLTAVNGSSMTYSNVEQEWLAFIRFTIMQYLIVVEEALSDFVQGRNKVKFNIETILRGDTKTRYESYKMAIDSGWLLKSEVRTIEDLEPIDGIDNGGQVNG